MPIRTMKFGGLRPDAGPYFNLGDAQTINLTAAFGTIKVQGGYAIQPFFFDNLADFTPTDYRQGLFSYSSIVSGAYENNFLLANKTSIRHVNHTGAAGATVSRGTSYTNTQPANNWQFTVYGQKTIATNGIDAIQSRPLDIGAVSFQKNNVITAPVTADPRASFVETFKDHVFIGDFDLTAGTSGGEAYGGAYGALAAQRYENAIWWSATDNATRFSDPATTPSIIGSDYRIFNDGLGGVIGLRAATDYLLVNRVNGISIITGPPFVRSNIETTGGSLFPNSLVRVNNNIYGMSRVGPVVIEDGRAVRRLGTTKISRWLMQIKNILENDSTDDHIRQIYGARNITGDYVYWTIKQFSKTAGVPYTNILAYSVDEDEFSLVHTDNVLSADLTTLEIGLICSYSVPYIDAYDYGDGVAGFGSVVIPAGTRNSLLTMSRDSTASGFVGVGNLRTSFIGIGDANGVYQVWKPKRIRPIYSVDRYDSSLQTVPSGWQSVFSNVFSRVDVFPRNRYSGVDTDYATSHNTDSASFVPLTGMNSDGWFNAEPVPYAHFHSIRFNLNGLNSLSIFQIVGFDMEFEIGGNAGAGQELVY